MQGLQSNRIRFYLLLSGVLLFLPIVWKTTLQKTIESRVQLRLLEEKIQMLETAPEQIVLVEKRLNYLGHLLASENNSNGIQSRALYEISDICREKGLLLKAMPPMFRNLDNNYLMETLNIEVAGSFHHLVQLLHLLEQPKKNMNVVSARFYTNENKRRKQKQLVLSLYIQTLQEKSNQETEN
jgi:Tfp pilus assembly protein PilO